MIPVIDVPSLVAGTSGRIRVAEEIGKACREAGFGKVSKVFPNLRREVLE